MEKRINQFVQKIIDDHKLPGLAVGVVKGQKVIVESGFGLADCISKQLVTTSSLFHLASISKLFVAAGILQLVAKGMLVLDAPIKNYLPTFSIKSEAYRKITVRQLLSHSAGLPDITNYHWNKPEFDDGALERYFNSLTDVELLYEPGQVFFYSNMGYEILGYLLSKLSGLTFEEFIRENVLLPIGMVTSTHLKNDVPTELAVAPHLRMLETSRSDIYPYNRAHAPSSTLHSSVHEMNLWAMFNLDKGHTRNKSILSNYCLEELWKSTILVDSGNPLATSIGLGWFLGKHRGAFAASHSGQDVGFTSQFMLVPEVEIGVTVLCNAAPAPTREIALAVSDLAMGHEPAYIKPSIMIPLGKTLKDKGAHAMKKHYQTLQKENLTSFDFNPGAFFQSASALLDNNQNTDAISLLILGLELSPKNAKGYELLARAYFQKGEFQEALSFALQSLEIEPNNAFLRQQIKPLLTEM